MQLDCYADEGITRLGLSLVWNKRNIWWLSGDFCAADACYCSHDDRQLTDSDLNLTGKAEDSPCSQRSDRSWRVGGTWRARWPWAPAHWEVCVREKPHGSWCTAWSSLNLSLSPSACRLFAVWLSPNCKFSSLKRQTTLLAHYHSSHFNSTKTFCLSLNSILL